MFSHVAQGVGLTGQTDKARGGWEIIFTVQLLLQFELLELVCSPLVSQNWKPQTKIIKQEPHFPPQFIFSLLVAAMSSASSSPDV